MANMSEDALFSALLRNKPKQQQPKSPVATNAPRKDVPKPAPIATHAVQPAISPIEISEKEEHPIEKKITSVIKPIDLEPVTDSIYKLNSSINMVYGLMKNIIVPVSILIFILLIGILIKIN